MSRLIPQASGYQADPDHAAQLSHHGESFSVIHLSATDQVTFIRREQSEEDEFVHEI